MEQNQIQPNHHLNNFINNVINDLKNLTNALRSLNRQAVDTNNSIINKLLLGNDRDSLEIIKQILTHLLHIVDLKGINLYILSILTKVISFIKIIEEEQLKREQKLFEGSIYSQEMSNILYHIIDIIFLFKNKHKETEMMLRIIQTTFSLIDIQILQYVNYHLLIRIYSICFECCLSTSIIQNISVSALFALTEIVFASSKTEDSSTILSQFLQYLLSNKKFSWIKDQDLKGMVWDLIIVGIKSYPTSELEIFSHSKIITSLLNEMYSISLKKIFSAEEKHSKHKHLPKKNENDKSNSPKKESHQQFIRYYKTFVFMSVHLSIKSSFYSIQIVPYRQSIQLFKIAYQLDRDSKLYLILEGISILIIEGSHLLIDDERTLLLLDILNKVIQELCLSNIQLQISSQARELYLEKMCGDLSKINDSDYVKLIRNTIIKLRKRFEGKLDSKVRTGELMTERTELSQKSQSDLSEGNILTSRKKWEKLLNNVIRIIRYLTSLNMKDIPNEQTVRKLIIELQYWYLICPSVKTRNLILQELLSTSAHIESKLQAIKVSQCVQIGSNIIYGYYDSLDSIGLTLILKMMARVKTSWEQGKGFEQLDEVCIMSQKLYIQQNLVHNQKSFRKTIQSFVQCVNGLIADYEQSAKEDRFKKTGRNPLQKLLKMVEYIFSKLQIILQQNYAFIHNEWNFLTGFWISLCCNLSQQIKQKTMNHVSEVIVIMLKKTQIKQEIILSTYLELCKLQSLEISKLILTQLKHILLIINREEAIVELFRIIRIIQQTKGSNEISNQVYELEEMLIKQMLFKIKSSQNLIFVLESLSTLNQSQNQEYKTVNLIWSISDHLKSLAKNKELDDIQAVWRKLFSKLYWLGLHSIHGQTKQSCIHTFTQIIAQSTAILGFDTCSSIIRDIYLQLFYVVMDLNQKSSKITGNSLAELVKVGIKNFKKLIKKCILDQIEHTADYLDAILDNFLQKFPKLNENQITIEYLFELCALLDFYKEVNQKKEQFKISVDIKKIERLIEMMEIFHKNLDHSGLFWRKKYEPTFQEMKRYFVQ